MAILSADPAPTPPLQTPRPQELESPSQEVLLQQTGRTSVPSRELESLAQAVERATFLNGDTSASSSTQLLDPSCMLEALGDVYAASLRLVRHSGLAGQHTPCEDKCPASSGSSPPTGPSSVR